MTGAKMILPVAAMLLWGCSGSGTSNNVAWNKEAAAKKCFDGATKGKYELDDAALKRLHNICDCAGEKMEQQFKTEKEADDKLLDGVYMMNDCRDAVDAAR
jgi:hypothetical protein